MIRDVKPQDATAITKIYNEYITNSIISFETEPLTEEDMLSRIVQISSKYPYFVYETDGIVVGYCYAHAWKERAAYRYTAETTVYLSPAYTGRGIGTLLMQKLIEECRNKNNRRQYSQQVTPHQTRIQTSIPFQKSGTKIRPMVRCRGL